ncbi:MAG: hypothetical protein A2X67_11060 [Ignavibacteria bacterium GWA2_55_11]|nr:MAG: hypothetical protein A2X67_11060 [Ignavibacteria bacterium GWA2_55_11]
MNEEDSMSQRRHSLRSSRVAYLILATFNTLITSWFAFSYQNTFGSTKKTVMMAGIVFFGVVALSYFIAFVISTVRPHVKPSAVGDIAPLLSRIRAFLRTLQGRMAASCVAIVLVTMVLMGVQAFGFVEVLLYEDIAFLSGWKLSYRFAETNRVEALQRSPALIVTVATPEPSAVQYLEGSLLIARELKPLGVRAFVVDTRPLTWSERERSLLAELDSVGTVYWASETPLPETRGGLITNRPVNRGLLPSLPRIYPLSRPSPDASLVPDILMKLTYNGRPNMQPRPIQGDGYVTADGIRIPVMSDGSVILRDPYGGFLNMELWTTYDPYTKKIATRSMWRMSSERVQTIVANNYFQSSAAALKNLYGIDHVKNKVAMLAWSPHNYKYFLEWWDQATALRAISMDSFVQMIPWLFWPVLLVSLTAVFLVSLTFRPFLALQLSFVIALIVLAAATYLYTETLYIFNGTYVLFALLVATVVLPFQTARDEAKAMAAESDAIAG